MDGFCRGCLIRYEEPTELLQYTERNRRLFVYSTGIQVKRNDQFTFQLCKECYLNMKVASKFKKLCRTSDKRFKNYLALKESGESIDICTFLKSNDDALTIRFPLMNGNSTPANAGNKDDDNESTCTSIRNFMTDILQGEEVPDTEARIINEVIQEEADVLEDSLDSHWLQDDLSIDTDFRLDFSFSQFSTPRSNDHFYTPKKLNDVKQEESEDHNYYTSKEDNVKEPQTENISIHNDKTNITELKYADAMDLDMDYFNMLDIKKEFNDQGINSLNFYIPTENNEEPVQIQLKDDKMMKSNNLVGNVVSKCTIDRNLREALKNESNTEFCLDDLLVSPQVPGESASSTPSITSILFGNKDAGSGNSMNKCNIGQCIEKYEHVKGDVEIDEKFFDRDNDHLFQNDDNDANHESVSAEKYFDLDNPLCKICNKQFMNPKALRIHATKSHNIKLNNPQKGAYKRKLRICEICGKEYKDSISYYKHKKQHKNGEENKTHECTRCSIVFSTASKLEMHMVTHSGKPVVKNTGEKFVCNICGAQSNHRTNFRIHKLRHTKNYTKFCEECGRGFFRSTDLITHMRSHTGERPFKCQYCERAFSRRNGLIRHIKLHTDEKRFCCDYCDKKFITKAHLVNHIFHSKSCIKTRTNLDEQNSKTAGSVDIFYTVGSLDKIKQMQLTLEMTKEVK